MILGSSTECHVADPCGHWRNIQSRRASHRRAHARNQYIQSELSLGLRSATIGQSHRPGYKAQASGEPPFPALSTVHYGSIHYSKWSKARPKVWFLGPCSATLLLGTPSRWTNPCLVCLYATCPLTTQHATFKREPESAAASPPKRLSFMAVQFIDGHPLRFGATGRAAVMDWPILAPDTGQDTCGHRMTEPGPVFRSLSPLAPMPAPAAVEHSPTGQNRWPSSATPANCGAKFQWLASPSLSTSTASVRHAPDCWRDTGRWHCKRDGLDPEGWETNLY